jgi:triacylglycerol lipase
MSVNAMCTRAGTKQVDLIGISMGGLIGLHYLRKLGGDPYIRRFVTIGTPFHGSHMARWMRLLTFGRATGAEQMIPGSDFLKDLHAHDAEHQAEIYSLHTSADAFVSEEAANLKGAQLVKSPHGVWPAGHYTPLFLQEDYRLIKEILTK